MRLGADVIVFSRCRGKDGRSVINILKKTCVYAALSNDDYKCEFCLFKKERVNFCYVMSPILIRGQTD